MEINMKNKVNGIYVESPRGVEGEAEFFLQTAGSHSVACGAHIHSAVELLYVRKGDYNVLLDGAEYKICEGDLILFCSNSVHYVTAGESPVNEYYVIKLPPTFFMELSGRETGAKYLMRFAISARERRILWRREELEGSELLPILRALIREHEENRYASEIATRLKITELLLEILREDTGERDLPDGHTVELIYGVMRQVRHRYSEDIDERELAQSVGMSYSYFSRSFKRISGMSFRRFLNLTRIRKAEQLLHVSDKSVTEIASRCGYGSSSYFIQVYKSITGKTPYKVRKGRE